MVTLRRLAGSFASLRGSLDSSVLESFSPGRGTGSDTFLVYANAERAYWLMPLDASTRHAALGLYSPQTFLGRVLQFSMRRGWACSHRIGLDEDRLADFRETLEPLVGKSGLRVAFSVGPPRPTQKITAVLIDGRAEVLAYAKVAFGGSAREALARERTVLRELASDDYLSAHVPTPIGWAEWNGGDVLVLSPGPAEAGPATLGDEHRDFLRHLHVASEEIAPFTDTRIRRRMAGNHDRLRGFLSYAWGRRYEQAMNHIDARLAGISMPTSLAHRDFTPWNTRVSSNGLFVFDWEMAEAGAIPAYDAFHFRAIQAALMGRPVTLDDWVPSFVQTVWPEGQELLPALWLTYLVDMSMVYANAHVVSAGIGDHRVLEWFGDEIDHFLVDDHARQREPGTRHVN
jgi:hypothetical protein